MPDSFERTYRAGRSSRGGGIASGIETAGDAIAGAIQRRQASRELAKANQFLLGKAGIDVAGVDPTVLSRLDPGDVLDIIAAQQERQGTGDLSTTLKAIEDYNRQSMSTAVESARGGGEVPDEAAQAASGGLPPQRAYLGGLDHQGRPSVKFTEPAPTDAEFTQQAQREAQKAKIVKQATAPTPEEQEAQTAQEVDKAKRVKEAQESVPDPELLGVGKQAIATLDELEKLFGVKSKNGKKSLGMGDRLGVAFDLNPTKRALIESKMEEFATHLARIRTGLAGDVQARGFVLDELGFGEKSDARNLIPKVLLERLKDKREEVLTRVQGLAPAKATSGASTGSNIRSITPVEE